MTIVQIKINVTNIKKEWGDWIMAKDKACKICKKIYEGSACPDCGAKEFTEAFKGRIQVVNHEKSEIAKKLDIKKEGNFAIKTR